MIRPVWATRTGSGLDPLFETYSQTIQEDAPYLVHDLHGSAAHVKGLAHAGLIAHEDADALLAGLADLKAASAAGAWQLDPSLEDVHMNIEAALTAKLGDVGKRLHTGRSRNDQVATCIVLYAREQLAVVAASAHRLAACLAAQAETHAETPWVAKTHGQPAQPATLGFLLAAHALRFEELAKQALQTFQAIGESPLGGGAVAGSTLPLEPAYTAKLLGLRPPRSALLATGARDHVLRVLQVTSTAGLHAASLAQDLLDLFTSKALQLPAGFTTGSSLMPHKRNPDALELARGKSQTLPGVYAQAAAVISGMGLGYQRDLQVVKPLLTQGLTVAGTTLDVLAACVQGAAFDVDALAATYEAPGITATDAAEALVAMGMPFREAYAILAQHAALVEDGLDPITAVDELELDDDHAGAVRIALAPDPARRATRGGPAPAAVKATLAGHAGCHATVATMLASAETDVAAPAALLEAVT